MKLRLKIIIVLACAMALLFCADGFCHPFDQTYESAVVALDTYRQLIKDYPDDLELHYLLGDMLIMANQLDEAEEKFRHVISVKPGHDMSWYKLSEILYRKKKYKEALAPLAKIKDPALQDERRIAESTIYLKLGDFKKAVDAADKAIKIDKKNPGGFLQKGLARKGQGKTDEAISLLLKSLKMDPSQPLVYEWFRDYLYESKPAEIQLKFLKELYGAIQPDTPTAAQIDRDIYQIKKKMKK